MKTPHNINFIQNHYFNYKKNMNINTLRYNKTNINIKKTRTNIFKYAIICKNKKIKIQ